MTHRDGLPRFSASGLYQLKCTPTIAFPVSSVGGEVPAMRGHPPSAAAAPLLRRKGRHAFPTPGGHRGVSPRLRYAGAPPRPPASSRAACGARTSRCDALLAGNLATPS